MSSASSESQSLASGKRSPLQGVLLRARIARARPYLRGDILDLGCGNAGVYQAAQGVPGFSSYTGIERREKDVAMLAERHPGATFVSGDLEAQEWPVDRKFDAVVGLALIEHIWNQHSFFSNVSAVLKPGGRAVFTTPTVTGNDLVLPLLSALRLVRSDVIDDHIVVFNRRRFEHVCREFPLQVEHHSRFQLGQNQIAVLRRR